MGAKNWGGVLRLCQALQPPPITALQRRLPWQQRDAALPNDGVSSGPLEGLFRICLQAPIVGHPEVVPVLPPHLCTSIASHFFKHLPIGFPCQWERAGEKVLKGDQTKWQPSFPIGGDQAWSLGEHHPCANLTAPKGAH